MADLALSRAALTRMLAAGSTLETELRDGQVRVQGDVAAVRRLLEAFERREQGFALIEP